MGKAASAFSRGGSKFEAEPIVLVLCEDSKSSKNYLQDAAEDMRAQTFVDIVHPGVTDPKNIVLAAVRQKNKFDSVYCVIDRDRHETFDEALGIAKANGIRVIPSYPCFEYWLLLHFGYTRQPFKGKGRMSPADEVCKELRKKEGMEDYDKGKKKNLYKQLLNSFHNAKNFASRALKDVELVGEANPSTHIHILLDEFEALSKPKKIK